MYSIITQLVTQGNGCRILSQSEILYLMIPCLLNFANNIERNGMRDYPMQGLRS